jgi:hypothetical protein
MRAVGGARRGMVRRTCEAMRMWDASRGPTPLGHQVSQVYPAVVGEERAEHAQCPAA